MTPAPATSLFLQALGLVVATLVAVLIATTVVILNIPQPAPDIYTVGEVAQALRTGNTAQTVEGRALDVRTADQPPVETPSFGRRHANFRAGLAEMLKLDPNQIVIVQDQPRLVFGGPPSRQPRRPPPPEGTSPEQTLLFGPFEAAVRMADGHWRVVESRRSLIDPWQLRVLLVLAAAAAAVTPLAWWFARRLAAPISAFASAAERLGRDPEAPPLNVRGSSEVRAAVAAFNEMQERLKRYVTYRTTMIAAIAHDLRTPLTRLRFRIEAAPDDLQKKLAADIDEMEAMISSTLAFVQDATRPRERTKLEVSSLLETVMDEAAETGRDAAVERAERAVVDGDPIALKRLVTNLVDNALKFGSKARGRVFSEAGMAVVEVDDDGPGVPESQIERAFEPFHRLEVSRSRDTGGIGLGLAVVRAIARGHGGEVVLQNRAGGGLRARVTLPLALRSAAPAPPNSAGAA
jgi:signal transduction histidine kinase